VVWNDRRKGLAARVEVERDVGNVPRVVGVIVAWNLSLTLSLDK
jgi:hypothetical protein